MDNLQNIVCSMLIVGSFFLAGCEPPTPPNPNLTFGNERLVEQLFELNDAFKARVGYEPKVAVIRNDNGSFVFNQSSWSSWRCGCTWVTLSNSPDIILRYELGSWSDNLTSLGFVPVLTRLAFNHDLTTYSDAGAEDGTQADGYYADGTPSTGYYSDRGWRQIELKAEYANIATGAFPEFQSNSDEVTTIAVAGHMRGMQDYHNDVFRMFADLINARSPDYVFTLGDLVFKSKLADYEQLHTNFYDFLTSDWFFVPGNHETRAVSGDDGDAWDTDVWKDDIYEQNMPELPTNNIITTNTVNLVPIDSSRGNTTEQAMDRLTTELTDAFDPANQVFNPNLPTIILVHHKMWEPTWWVKNGWPIAGTVPGTKSYAYAADFMPLIADKGEDVASVGLAAGIIDGDAYTLVKHNTLSWWNDLPVLSVGMGTKGAKGNAATIHFAIVKIAIDGVMRTHPFYIDFKDGHEFYSVNDPRDG